MSFTCNPNKFKLISLIFFKVISRVATQSITHPEALSFFLATVCHIPAHNSPEHAAPACSFCTMVLVPPKAPALAVEPPSVSSYLPRLVSRLRPSVSSTLKNILKSSACSGRREALAANHQATRGHEIDLFTPPHHPYNTAEEAHTLPGRARPKDPECPSRLPHPTTRHALSYHERPAAQDAVKL